MPTVAAIDIGSNSVRLLVLDPEGNTLAREMNITRLAQGVDADGTLAPPAMQRTVDVLKSYGATLRKHKATRVRIGATSAARDASNCSDFFDMVEAAVGTAPELLSGQAEAALSFAGATAEMPRPATRTVTLDIGGGSTEFAVGHSQPESSLSLDIGCVRLTERFFQSDPPSKQEMHNASVYVRAQLEKADESVPCRGAETWLGLAGTATSLAAFDANLTRYDATISHGYVLTRSRVEAMHEQLSQLNSAARAPLLLNPRRAEVMVGGTLILRDVMNFFQVESMIVSERDILDGLAASLRN